MGYRTYTAKLDGVTVQIKMAKADAQRVANRLKDIVDIRKYRRETTGTVGGDEHTSTFMSLFGPDHELAAPDAYEADKVALLEAASAEVITYENWPALQARRDVLFERHIPRVDSRQSPEERAEQHQAVLEAEQERKAKAAAFLAEFSSGEQVTIPSEHMAIYLELTYDDSDSMTDYFNRHARYPHSVDLLLQSVPQGPQTERKARAAVALYPELAKLNYTWHTENWSGGHGNYLISEKGGGIIEGLRTYGGREAPIYRYEIRIAGWTAGTSMPAFRGYPGCRPPAEPASACADNGTVRLEQDRDWLWVYFPAKPADEVLARLRALGGRFSRRRQGWYFQDASLKDKVRQAVGL